MRPARARYAFLSVLLATAAATAAWNTTAADAADAAFQTLTTTSNPDWMRSVPDDVSVAALSIPGTHDTMAIRGGSFAQTQEDHGDSGRTLAAQLDAGIRAVDIRVRVNNGNTFTVHHGAVYQVATFDDVLNTLAAFLDAHPGEAVLTSLHQECTGEFFSCTDAGGQASFPDIFRMYRDNSAAARAHLWAPAATGEAAIPTLGEVRGKIIMINLSGSHGGHVDGFGLSQFHGWNDGSHRYVQNEYNVPNVGAIATKRDQVRRFVDVTDSGDPSQMYINFTSGAGILANPAAVAGGSGPEQGVNSFPYSHLGDGNATARTGVIMSDFPGGGLITTILSRNPQA
jgi:hypothetical protein